MIDGNPVRSVTLRGGARLQLSLLIPPRYLEGEFLRVGFAADLALVILFMMVSLPLAWRTPTPWIEAERRAWRASLTGPVTPREAWNRQVVPRGVLDWGAGIRPRGDVTPAILSGL